MSRQAQTEYKSRDTAPTQSEFQQLLSAVEEEMSGEMKLQSKFILLTIGRLGLRAGELTHIQTKDPKWVDLHQKTLTVPSFTHCECGYCRKQAKQRVEKNDDVSFGEAMRDRWEPVHPSAERTIYFGWSDEIVKFYKTFFDIYDGWPRSRSTVNRRIDRVIEAADFDRNIDSRSLRNTAAEFHAMKGMNAPNLSQFMGWSKESEAIDFVRSASPDMNTQLRTLHSD